MLLCTLGATLNSLRRCALSRWCCNCPHLCKSAYVLGWESISTKFRNGNDLSATEVRKSGERMGEKRRTGEGEVTPTSTWIWASPCGYRSSSFSGSANATCVAWTATGVPRTKTPLTLTNVPDLRRAKNCATVG